MLDRTEEQTGSLVSGLKTLISEMLRNIFLQSNKIPHRNKGTTSFVQVVWSIIYTFQR